MSRLPLPQRLAYGALGRLYWLSHWLQNQSLLGARFSTLLLLLLGVLLLWAWRGRWAREAVILLALLWLAVWLAQWLARRANYHRFVGSARRVAGGGSALAVNERVRLQATGIFSAEGNEASVLLAPAAYWRVPRGDHVVMAERERGRYLYQIIERDKLHKVTPGWLLFGARPWPALGVSYRLPETSSLGRPALRELAGKAGLVGPASRTIYLAFTGEAALQAVAQAIGRDLEQAGLGTDGAAGGLGDD